MLNNADLKQWFQRLKHGDPLTIKIDNLAAHQNLFEHFKVDFMPFYVAKMNFY